MNVDVMMKNKYGKRCTEFFTSTTKKKNGCWQTQSQTVYIIRTVAGDASLSGGGPTPRSKAKMSFL